MLGNEALANVAESQGLVWGAKVGYGTESLVCASNGGEEPMVRVS